MLDRDAARTRYWTGVDQLHVAEIAGDCHLMAGYPFGDTVAVFQGDEAEAYANLCAGAVHDLPAALDELDARDAEIERLRGLLKPFGKVADVWEQTCREVGSPEPEDDETLMALVHSDHDEVVVTLGDLRRIRAALEGRE